MERASFRRELEELNAWAPIAAALADTVPVT